MRRSFFVKFIIGLAIFMIVNATNILLAATKVNQTISIPVAIITEFTTTGIPTAMVVNSVTPGFQPDQALSANTTYNITTNESNKKITGILDSAMPANTVLTVNLAAPAGATSLGDVALSTVAADLVTGISQTAASGKTITYKFLSSVTAGIVPSTSRVVTFTVTN
ncbi:MAG TPA: hypothetical protein VHY08_19450 [Bacillota bacterium]|nr:hypothetical protein [Bacillota bacterium]